jgi:D-serine ammonia-lyase
MLDLQQLHTGLIDRSQIAQRVLATVISYYPGRGESGSDEALCDAGAIAMSKDTGPSGVFGEVIGKPWNLGRISQEHGILTRTKPSELAGSSELGAGDGEDRLELGSMIEIVGQHACLTASAYPWYYVVDSSVVGGHDHVQDIWVPWKGW